MPSTTLTPDGVIQQNFTVPAGVTELTVDLVGAAGGITSTGQTRGKGARLQFKLAVTAGEVYNFNVGGQGGDQIGSTTGVGQAVGTRLGGNTWRTNAAGAAGGGGGGATGVGIGVGVSNVWIAVAAGGGGAGAGGTAGGDAGAGSTSGTAGTTGYAAATTNGGGGATSSSNGSGGTFTNSAWTGWNGGYSTTYLANVTSGGLGGGTAITGGGIYETYAGGGGGGGGWRGGGGGAGSPSTGTAGGGGGGMSSVLGTVTSLTETAAYNTGDGYVVLTWPGGGGIYVDGAVHF